VSEEPADGDASRWLIEDGAGISAFGPIPDGHEGHYQPSAEDLKKGFRVAFDASIEIASERAKIAQECVQDLFDAEAGES
jgi:hypothetical protein